MDVHLARLRGKFVAAKLDEPRVETVRGPSAPRDRADPRQQLARREGLGHVVVGAHLESEDLVTLLDPPGDHDHGDCVGPGGGDDDVVALAREVVADQLGDVALVLDDEDAPLAGGGDRFHPPRVSARRVPRR